MGFRVTSVGWILGLPLGTGHGAEALGALELVGEVNAAAELTLQLGRVPLLFGFWGAWRDTQREKPASSAGGLRGKSQGAPRGWAGRGPGRYLAGTAPPCPSRWWWCCPVAGACPAAAPAHTACAGPPPAARSGPPAQHTWLHPRRAPHGALPAARGWHGPSQPPTSGMRVRRGGCVTRYSSAPSWVKI